MDPTVGGAVLDWGYWLETLFSSAHEVHAFQLGVAGAIAVVGLLYAGWPRTAGGTFLALLALAFGVPNLATVCDLAYAACESHPIQVKPWYFLGGLYAATFATPPVVVFLDWLRWREPHSS